MNMFSNNVTPADSSTVITCLEHEHLTVADFSDDKDFSYLLDANLPCFNIGFEAGHVCLKIKHYLAKIVLPSGMSLEILPKISSQAHTKQAFTQQSRPQQFLDKQLFSEHAASAQADQSHTRYVQIQQARIWVAQMLIDIAEYDLQKKLPALNLMPNAGKMATDLQMHTAKLDHLWMQQSSWYQGFYTGLNAVIEEAVGLVPHHYQAQSHNSPQARGKINLTAQVKHNWHRPHYVYSEQSTFTQNDPVLQFMATAWQQLQVWLIGHTPFSNSYLKGQAAYLSHITPLPRHTWQPIGLKLLKNDSPWMAQLPVTQKYRLQQALLWCDWILNHFLQLAAPTGTQNSTNTQRAMPAFMINMNHAFERWVVGRLKIWVNTHLPHSSLLTQPKFDWLASSPTSNPLNSDDLESDSLKTPQVIQRLIPDACIESATGKVTHVIDIKYKSINRVQDVTGTDWQQLMVYQHYLQSQQAWLIYPMSHSFKQAIDVSVIREFSTSKLSQTVLSVVPFDLQQRQIMV